jgi:hypothetical protein
MRLLHRPAWERAVEGENMYVDADPTPPCVDDDDHEWHPADCGCDTNPGVYAVGGTAFEYYSRCRICGIVKMEYTPGARPDPDDCEVVRYDDSEPTAEAAASEDWRRAMAVWRDRVARARDR